MSLLKRFWITTIISLFCCTVFSLSCCANDTTKITLPTKIVRQMFKDVKERDHLKADLNLADSTIHVYEQKDSVSQKEILSLKLSRDQFKEVIADMEKMARVRQTEYKDKERRLKTAIGVIVISDVLKTILIILLL